MALAFVACTPFYALDLPAELVTDDTKAVMLVAVDNDDLERSFAILTEPVDGQVTFQNLALPEDGSTDVFFLRYDLCGLEQLYLRAPEEPLDPDLYADLPLNQVIPLSAENSEFALPFFIPEAAFSYNQITRAIEMQEDLEAPKLNRIKQLRFAGQDPGGRCPEFEPIFEPEFDPNIILLTEASLDDFDECVGDPPVVPPSDDPNCGNRAYARLHTLGIPIDQNTALIAARGKRLLFVRDQVKIPFDDEPVTLPEGVSTSSITAGFRDEQGDIWLFTEDAQLLRGRIETTSSGFSGSFQTISSTTADIPFELSANKATAMDGVGGDDPEIFASSGLGSAWRFYQGQWEIIQDRVVASPVHRQASIAYRGNGQAFATYLESDNVLEYDEGSALNRYRIQGRFGASVVTRTSKGLLLGTRTEFQDNDQENDVGRLFFTPLQESPSEERAQWTEMPDYENARTITEIEETKGGLLIGEIGELDLGTFEINTSRLNFYIEPTADSAGEVCNIEEDLSFVSRIVSLGNDFLLIEGPLAFFQDFQRLRANLRAVHYTRTKPTNCAALW